MFSIMDKVTSLKHVLGHESIPFVFGERKYRILDRRLCFQVSDSACAACAQMSHMSCWRTSTPSLGPCCPTPMRSWSLRRGWMRLRAWRSRRINPGRKMDYSGISVVIVVVDLLGSVLDRLWSTLIFIFSYIKVISHCKIDLIREGCLWI